MTGMHTSSMHGFHADNERLARLIVDYVVGRLRQAPPPLDGPRPLEELVAAAGTMITEHGIVPAQEAALRQLMKGKARHRLK